MTNQLFCLMKIQQHINFFNSHVIQTSGVKLLALFVIQCMYVFMCETKTFKRAGSVSRYSNWCSGLC